MEISELLRRGDFSRSKIFQSISQVTANGIGAVSSVQDQQDHFDRSVASHSTHGTKPQLRRTLNAEIHPLRTTNTATTTHSRLTELPPSFPSSYATISTSDMKPSSSIAGNRSLVKQQQPTQSSKNLNNNNLKRQSVVNTQNLTNPNNSFSSGHPSIKRQHFRGGSETIFEKPSKQFRSNISPFSSPSSQDKLTGDAFGGFSKNQYEKSDSDHAKISFFDNSDSSLFNLKRVSQNSSQDLRSQMNYFPSASVTATATPSRSVNKLNSMSKLFADLDSIPNSHTSSPLKQQSTTNQIAKNRKLLSNIFESDLANGQPGIGKNMLGNRKSEATFVCTAASAVQRLNQLNNYNNKSMNTTIGTQNNLFQKRETLNKTLSTNYFFSQNSENHQSNARNGFQAALAYNDPKLIRTNPQQKYRLISPNPHQNIQFKQQKPRSKTSDTTTVEGALNYSNSQIKSTLNNSQIKDKSGILETLADKEITHEDEVTKEKSSTSLTKLMGIVRIKKKLTGYLKERSLASAAAVASSGEGPNVSNKTISIMKSGSSINNMHSYSPDRNKKYNFSKRQDASDENEVLQFEKHDEIVYELLNDENGCEYYDIYGTFNDKLKHIQESVFDALHQFSLASAVLQELREQKKQSRVIDVVENTLVTIMLVLEHLERVPQILHQREELDKTLASMAISLVKSTSANLTIQIETVLIYAQFNQAISNFGKALRLFKQVKYMAVTHSTLKYRLRCYAAIGLCFQNLKLYGLAMVYFGKFLEHAWYLCDKEAELSAYDLIGVTSYLIGDLETAKFYHEKMLKNDNEPEESPSRLLGIKKVTDKLKKINSEEYSAKLSLNYKKFFAKIHSSDYEEDYVCSSSDDDEFKISIPKRASQKANQEYEQYLIDLGPKQKKKVEQDQKRFIAIFNAEDRLIQMNIKQQANQNIRMEEARRIAFSVMPNSLKHSLTASSFKPIASSMRTPFRISQFTINRNLDNYLCQDSRILKNSPFDFFKLVEDTNDRKVKEKIIGVLSKFESNLIFALSLIHSMREREKSVQNRRRFAFSGIPVTAINTDVSGKNLLELNIDIVNSRIAEVKQKRKKVELSESKSKPNSNKEQFMVLQRYQHVDLSNSLAKK